MVTTNANQPSWTNRRRFMLAVNLFCMSVVIWVLAERIETAAAEAAVMFSFMVIGGTLGSYVFSAAWQDIRLGQADRLQAGAQQWGPSYAQDAYPRP